MNDKIKKLDKEWQEELSTFAYNKKYKTIEEKKIYWDKESEEYDIRMYQDLRRVDDVVNLFKNKNVLSGKEDILEIGCGTGLYSLALAPFCNNVTAFDLSGKMGEVLIKNANEKGINNINFTPCNWSGIDVKKEGLYKKFDIVLSALNPGINSYDALVKLIEASKKCCCVVVFAKNPENTVRHYFNKTENSGADVKKQDSLFIYDILTEMGYYPQIYNTKMEWVKENTKHDAKIRLFKEYEKLYDNKEQLLEQIENFVEENTDTSEIFKEFNKSSLAIIYWEV